MDKLPCEECVRRSESGSWERRPWASSSPSPVTWIAGRRASPSACRSHRGPSRQLIDRKIRRREVTERSRDFSSVQRKTVVGLWILILILVFGFGFCVLLRSLVKDGKKQGFCSVATCKRLQFLVNLFLMYLIPLLKRALTLMGHPSYDWER